MSQILVVEDDPVIRQTVDYALRRAGFSTTLASDGRAALEIATQHPPDLVLLDLMLPGMDGHTVAERLREVDSEVAIIMVTALGSDADKVRGLDAGADDYITKPFSTDELLARIRANLRRSRQREVLRNPDDITVGDLFIEPSQLRLTVAGSPVKLRLKEFQLLVALASQPGVLMTRQQLTSEVWGYDFLPSSRTIDVHIRRVRQALAAYSAIPYITTVHGVGYRFETAADPQEDER